LLELLKKEAIVRRKKKVGIAGRKKKVGRRKEVRAFVHRRRWVLIFFWIRGFSKPQLKIVLIHVAGHRTRHFFLLHLHYCGLYNPQFKKIWKSHCGLYNPQAF